MKKTNEKEGSYFGKIYVNGQRWSFEFNQGDGVTFLQPNGKPLIFQPTEYGPVLKEFKKWRVRRGL